MQVTTSILEVLQGVTSPEPTTAQTLTTNVAETTEISESTTEPGISKVTQEPTTPYIDTLHAVKTTISVDEKYETTEIPNLTTEQRMVLEIIDVEDASTTTTTTTTTAEPTTGMIK